VHAKCKGLGSAVDTVISPLLARAKFDATKYDTVPDPWWWSLAARHQRRWPFRVRRCDYRFIKKRITASLGFRSGEGASGDQCVAQAAYHDGDIRWPDIFERRRYVRFRNNGSGLQRRAEPRRGQCTPAANIYQAFIHEVEAQVATK
jgi:hypothetical protein